MRQAGLDTGPTGGRAAARDRSRRAAPMPGGRRAAARFEQACVRLAWGGPKQGSVWLLDELTDEPASTCEAEAGRALVELGAAGDGASLRRLLRPDPACETASWSVACYRIGDLVPHVLRDFPDPLDALETLTDCGDADHLAAELVASTAGGLSWVALVRTGAQVRFQPFGAQSVLARPGRRPPSDEVREAVDAARARWLELVASWHARRGPTGRIPAAPGTPAAVPRSWEPAAAAAQASAAVPFDPGAPLGPADPTGWERLDDVMDVLDDLADAVAGIANVVERLERSLGAVVARLDAAVPGPARPVARARPARRPRSAPEPLGATELPGEPERPHALDAPGSHWWTSKHRSVRRRPPLEGSASEPK